MIKNNRIIKIALCLCIFLIIGVINSNTVFSTNKSEEEINIRVEEILENMTLKEKVAQMLFVHVPSESPKEKQKNYQYGGYIMFGKEFNNKTKKSIKNTIKGWQKVSKINMLIGVDEEGGTVVRVSKYKAFRNSPFSSPRNVYKKGGYTAITSDTKQKAKLLKSLGINTNFAPVADVAYKKSNYMYNRSFSTNAKQVSKFIKLSVKEYNKNNLISMMKHFPGYGGNGNTHNQIITDTRSLKTLEKRDLLPFAQGIKEECPMILVSHNIVKCLDKNNTASLSKKVYQYLRKNMGYDGVIITDSLGMAAVTKKYKSKEKAAVKAVQSGNDMLCTPYGFTSLNAIYKAVKDGRIKEKQINASVKRILSMKLKYGIIK